MKSLMPMLSLSASLGLMTGLSHRVEKICEQDTSRDLTAMPSEGREQDGNRR